MKKKSKEESNSIKTFILYAFFVCTIILISLSVKAIAIVRESKFDGSNFVLAVSNKDREVVKVVGFEPDNDSISVLNIENSKISIEMLPSEAGIGYEGFLHINTDNIDDKTVSDILSGSFFDMQEEKTNLTIFDKIALFYQTKKTPAVNIYREDIEYPIAEREINRISQELFIDDSIQSESTSIMVVNASGIRGLGNSLSRVISNRGGNVVAVESAENIEKKSKIKHFNDKDYTVEKLSKLTGFVIEDSDEKEIAEIVIIIGEDVQDPKGF